MKEKHTCASHMCACAYISFCQLEFFFRGRMNSQRFDICTSAIANILAPYLLIHELHWLRTCNRYYARLFMKLYIQKLWWTPKNFALLSAENQQFIKRFRLQDGEIAPSHVVELHVKDSNGETVAAETTSKQLLPSNLSTLTIECFYKQWTAWELPTSLTDLTIHQSVHRIGIDALPSKLKVLKFGHSFNQSILCNVLPSKLTALSFGHGYIQPLLKDALPPKLRFLKFGNQYNTPFQMNVLPSSLKTLHLGRYFNQSFDPDILPSSLECLKFGYYYDQTLHPNVLPSNLTSLTFGYCFDQPIAKEVLPKRLLMLEFGYNFNQLIAPEVLPTHLTSLTFGYCFNQVIRLRVLPAMLKALKFGPLFNQPLDAGVLPPTIISLTFGYFFRQRWNQSELSNLDVLMLHPNRGNQALKKRKRD